MRELEQLYGQRQELRELRKELNKQIKLLEKEVKSLEKTSRVLEVKGSANSVLITGTQFRSAKIIQTKIHLIRKVVNRLQGEEV